MEKRASMRTTAAVSPAPVTLLFAGWARGGLMLLALHGPGGISLDKGAKKSH